MGKAVRRQRDEKAGLLVKEQEKNRKLRKLVRSQLVEIIRLASVNEVLRVELALERAIAERKVVRGAFEHKPDI
ncbi:hypothetical protein D3C80_1818860 [compost metagenome]